MISQTAKYALRAAAALAACGNTPCTGRALAAQTRIPRGYLTKVLAPLVRASLVQATRGAGGGYTLKRDPASIALIEVVHAIEPQPSPPDAQPPGLCALHRRIEQATALFEEVLQNCTLAEVVACRPRPRVAGAAPPPCTGCRSVQTPLRVTP